MASRQEVVMPATFSPIDLGSVTSLQQGDERTLERLFRDHYDALAEEARPIVGDDVTASRVVERAFVRTWRDRSHFDSPEALTGFLHETVHDEAKVMLHRRLMLHRIEEHEGAQPHATPASGATVPVDEAWKHVHEAIHVEALDRKALARDQAEHSRHEAAEHVAGVGKPRPWKGPVAIGADSRLLVPSRFDAPVRAVKLEGTASFTVAPRDKPFHVVAGDAMITATGTEFAVRSYPGDELSVIRVHTGSVSVKRGNETRALGPGGALAIPATGPLVTPSAELLAESFSWMDGRVVAREQPLRAVLKQFTRWYGIEFKIKDPPILDRPVTVDASLDSSREAITALERSGRVIFSYEGKQMMLADSGSVKKK
jgi:DNA-directed RNA polymerase specialized sigma24 family protein